MSDCAASTGLPEPAPDLLQERLAEALPRLTAHFARRSGSGAGVEPDDLAQEVVARALRYRASYDPARALWPWLMRVAERVLHDQRSRHQRQPTPVAEFDPPAPRAQDRGETVEEIATLLARLRPIERDVLVRFHQRGQSVQEIAAALAIPEGTVKSHLSRARRRLAELPGTEDLS